MLSHRIARAELDLNKYECIKNYLALLIGTAYTRSRGTPSENSNTCH
jgi:hypothetical protein